MATYSVSKKTAYITNLKKEFPPQDFGLTEKQMKILGLLALSDDGDMTQQDIEKSMRKYYGGTTGTKGTNGSNVNKEIKRDIDLLRSNGMISLAYTWNGFAYEVADQYFMKAGLNALLYCTDLPQGKHNSYPSSRLNLLKALYENDKESIHKIFSTPGYGLPPIATELYPVMQEPAFSMIFSNIGAEDLELLVIFRLLDSEESAELTAGTISRMDEFLTRYVQKRSTAISSKLNLYHLLADGTWTEQETDDNQSIAATAIRELYKGNYISAAKEFDKALKSIRARIGKLVHHFNSPILTYFMVASYILSGDDAHNKKLSPILKRLASDYSYSASAYLIQKALGRKDETIERNLPPMKEASPLTLAMLSGIGRHLGVKLLPKDVTVPKPLTAIIRHETGIGVNADEARKLESLFGGPSITSRFKFMQPWENDLKILEGIVDKNTALEKNGSAADKRLIYIIGYKDSITIKEQGILKSGNWSMGKNAAISSLCSGIYSQICDEMDNAVINRIRSGTSLQAGHVFPLLIGCDRVFLDRYGEENRVTIREEIPFLSLEQDSTTGEFVFKTNVPISRYVISIYRENVIKTGPKQYSVINVNPAQKMVLEQIFTNTPRYPASAEKALAALIPRLEKIIEVHSEHFSSASAVEEKPGNPTIHIRIDPRPGTFALTLYVRPLDGGTLTCEAAAGDTVVFDTADGKRYQVRRDMKTERANIRTLADTIDFESMDCDELQFFATAAQMLDLVEKARGLTGVCVLEWPEGKELKVIGKLEAPSININVVSHESWFEVEGSAATSDGREFSLDQIMAAISAGGYSDGYLKLGDDEYAALSESLAKHLKRMESMGQMQKGKEKVPAIQAGLLAEMIKKSGVNAEVDKRYTAALKRMKEAEKLVPEVPSGLKADLRDYQLDGFRWMAKLDHWGAGACLADDMGLGKTVQTIAFLLYKAAAGPSLVVAPTSVIMNWQRELERFAPALKPVVFNEADDRKAAIDSAEAYDVVLMTYGLMAKEQKQISSVKWNVVCLDEAHTIKNRDTKMSAAAMSINAGSRIILTGTPVQNYLGELWNLFQFINPGLLGNFEQFSSKFIAPIANGDRDRQSQLKRIIQPFLLRRTKSEVVEELPEKTDITRLIELSPAETVVYETMREDAKSKLESEGKVNVNALAAITRLREAACAMPLVRKGWKEEPTKISALMELVQEIVSGGNSVLVFSQFTGFLDIVSSALTSAGISHFYLNGTTPMKRRQEMVSDFQHGARPVFLISLKAGGLGLNLTGANYVIHMDPWWNPAIEQQATDRAYRIGQQQNVTVYHLIAKGTIEEKILRLHKVKQNLADSILEGTSQAHALTLNELRELLNK